MSRVTLLIAMFLVLMNSTSVALAGSGWCDAADICLDPGGDRAVGDAQDASEQVTGTQSGDAQTLFTTIATAVRSLTPVLILLVVGGPVMLANIGIPSWGLTLVFAPAYLIVAADAVHLLINRDTI